MAHREQKVEQGTIQLQDGGRLPISTYNSELLRLQAEAIAAGAGNCDPRWIRRRIKQDIPVLYGRLCWRCEKPIIMRWNKEPKWKELYERDRHPQYDTAWFHAECVQAYERENRNKRRRTVAAAKHAQVVNQQAAGAAQVDNQQAAGAAQVDNQQAAGAQAAVNPATPPAAPAAAPV